jgi:hypothetical protein
MQLGAVFPQTEGVLRERFVEPAAAGTRRWVELRRRLHALPRQDSVGEVDLPRICSVTQ